MQQVHTVKDFSTYAAAQFLRTAVIIDDKIYEPNNRKLNIPVILEAPQRKKAIKPQSETPFESTDITPEIDTDQIISWQDSVRNFAKKHIVCALYQPDKHDEYTTQSDVYQLCLASDIVIVDWNLHGDDGQKALQLITNLVHNSLEDIPEQLRLILVYTSEPNLQSTANSVFEKLKTTLGEGIEPQTEDDGLSMHTSNSRIVILGKPTHLPRLTQYHSHEVTENRLAERSIEEFSKLASGLLQGAVLLGLAKIRENSRKILSKFDKSLDPAFLVHRAMSLPHEEACEHMHPLLVAELNSILHDCLDGQIIPDYVIENWITAQSQQIISNYPPFSSAADLEEFIKCFFLNNEKTKDKYKNHTSAGSFVKKLLKNEKESIKKLSKILELDFNFKSNHKFAILMSHRTSYGNIKKPLTLGTIIRKGTINDPQYLLCLLPICDTVRLIEPRHFVFCALNVMKEGDSNKKINHIIEDENEFIELLYTPKSYNCLTIEFKPDLDTKTVTAKKDNKNNLNFTCKSRLKYKWIAQLKPEHAQRAAEQFSRELSRVGLTESEWLRLMSK